MYSPEAKILGSIEDSYFLKSSLSVRDEPNQLWTEEGRGKLYEAYRDSMNPNGQYGFSKSQNAIYLKMFKVLFYEKGGHVVLPVYIMNSSIRGIYEEKNLRFKEWWDKYSFQCTREEYKGLKQTTYNHAFPDGRLIEYVFEENFQFKDPHVEKMYYDTTRLKNYTLLKEEIEECSYKKDVGVRKGKLKI